MFGNFIYFIVVLLIYATYQPAEDTALPPGETLAFFFGLIAVFVFFTWIQFQRLIRLVKREPFLRLDHRFNAAMTRQSIMAIALFAVDIYVLDLTAFLSEVPLFSAVPTLEAVLFLGIFIGYLAIVWGAAHPVYRRLYGGDLSRRTYVLSNISFSVPVLLPWFLLSIIADLLRLLPFPWVRAFFATAYGEILYFLVFLLAVALFGPFLIQKFWRCKPLEPGYERYRIEALCRKAGLAYADILYWPIFGGKMITAGVMGLMGRFRYILVTEALLGFLSPEEVDAVIAHEIGHVKRRHLLFYLFFFVGYMLLSYATFDLIIYSIIYLEPLYGFINDTGFNQATVTSTLFSLLIILIFLVYFRYIFGYFMRNFERQADTYVYSLFDSARPLIRTFEKITLTSGQDPDRPNWHHFSITQRIGYLKKCEADRRWIRRHDGKIKKSIFVYLTAMAVMGVVGYHLNFGETGEKLNAHVFEKIILREIEKEGGSAGLYRMLGDLYYGKKRYAAAVDAYERSIRMESNNPEVLNNLAWLYATSEETAFRNPKRAVALARKAAALRMEPHILDTLAESYFVNGQMDRAVEAGRRALSAARKNRSYYEEQLEKFETAAAEGGVPTPSKGISD